MKNTLQDFDSIGTVIIFGVVLTGLLIWSRCLPNEEESDEKVNSPTEKRILMPHEVIAAGKHFIKGALWDHDTPITINALSHDGFKEIGEHEWEITGFVSYVVQADHQHNPYGVTKSKVPWKCTLSGWAEGSALIGGYRPCMLKCDAIEIGGTSATVPLDITERRMYLPPGMLLVAEN